MTLRPPAIEARLRRLREVCRRLRQYREEAIGTGSDSVQAERAAWTSYARILLSANEFVYVD